MNKLLFGGVAVALGLSPAVAQMPAPTPPMQHEMAGHAQQTRTRADVAVHVRTMFARVDANHDGFITKAEGEAARGQMKQKMAQRKMARAASSVAPFDRLDANHDGAISRAEFDAAHAQRTSRMDRNGDGMPDRRMAGMHMGGKMGMGGRMFDMADANRDSRVSMQEATEAALKHFDLADANRDGQLTPQERMQMHQRMRMERKPG